MNAQKRSMFGGRRRGGSPLSPRKMGLIAGAIALVVLFAAFHQDEISSIVTPHETLTAEFPRQFKLVFDSPYTSEVKLAGVIVGKVGNVERTDRNTALVSLELEPGTLAKLGSTPRAAIVAKLIVAGNYYVDLIPGGPGRFSGGTIPPERTRLPVELENVLGAVSTPQAVKGVQSALGQTDKLLAQGGRDAARDLVAHAPPTLRPAGDVLNAFRGTEPDTDLTTLVTGFESTATAFNEDPTRFGKILNSLDATTAALAAGSQPLSDSIATGKDTLRVTRAGLKDLQPTLDQLTDTAADFDDAAERLDPFLRKLNPVLKRAKPVVHDLKDVTEDLRPVIDRLVPTVEKATDTLDNLHGPVLDKLNGKIQEVLYAPWHGTGVYRGGGADRPLFKEIGYLMVDIDSVMANHDGNVALARLHASGGGRTIGGQSNPPSSEQAFERFGLQQPPGPNEGGSNSGPTGLMNAMPHPAAPAGPRGNPGGLLPSNTGGR